MRSCLRSGRVSALFAASLVGLSLLGLAAPSDAQVKKPAPAATKNNKKPVNPKDPKLLEAKRLFEAGEELYAKGDYEKAIESWEMSFELSGKDLILESIANAYERLGKAEKAREYLGKWREAAPAEEHADLDARLSKLDQRIAKEKAELEAKEKAEKEAKAKREAEERSKQESGGKIFVPGLVIGGVGAAAAITGGVLDILAGTRRPDAAAVCATSPDGKQLCRSSAQNDIETSNTFATVGDILLIGGGVATAVGVVLVVTQSGSKKGKEDKKAAVLPWFLPGGGGVVAGGSF